MDSKFSPYLIATAIIIFFSVAGLLKIINIPSLDIIFYQRLIFSIAVSWTVASPFVVLAQLNKDTIDSNQLAVLKQFESRQRQILKTLTASLLENQNLSESQIAHQIRSLPEFGRSKAILQNQPKKKISTTQNKNVNLILIAIARHIIAMKPIKFSGKEDVMTSQIDATFFIEAQNIEVGVSNYLREALYNSKIFGNDLSYKRFLSKLLVDNDFFLGGLRLNPNVRKNLEKGLLKFNQNLDVEDKKASEPIKSKENPITIYPKVIAPDQASKAITAISEKKEIEVLKPPAISFEDNKTDLVLDSKTNADEVATKIEELLKTHNLEGFAILINHGKKIEFRIINAEALPIFRKIAHQRTEGKTSFNPAELDNIFLKIITEYQNSEEYHDQKRQIKAKETLERALKISDQYLQKDVLMRWEEFVAQERKQEFTSRNYQKFADFLNNSNYLRNFAKIGEVRLKGSYLYGDLLNLRPVAASDIDLEIFIPDLFSEGRVVKKIIELIKENLGFEIAENLIKIKENLYVQFEFTAPNGMKIDLSFYDRNKLPSSDWIFSVDALRLDLTKNLQSEKLIKCEDLLSTKPSLSNGFLTQYPRNNIDQILDITKSGVVQLVNPKARDLVFNVVKKIKNGVVKIEQVQSLYKNNEDFQKAFDENWSLLITDLDNFRIRCENANIEGKYFDDIRKKIMGVSVKPRDTEQVIFATPLNDLNLQQLQQ